MTKHTCGGPAYGRLTKGCPRCDELLAGKPARMRSGQRTIFPEGLVEHDELAIRDRLFDNIPGDDSDPFDGGY